MIWLRPYLTRRMIVIFLLGISSGFPLALCFGTLTAWLTESGISKQSIGLFGAITFPYALKFLWSPVFDAVKIPFLSKLLGKRRAWLIITQILLMASVIGLGTTSPETDIFYTALLALVVSFFSASQDINVDAYRTEYLDKQDYGYGSAAAVFGYRVGMLFSGAGALFIADAGISWHGVYFIMSLITFFGIGAVLLGAKPESEVAKSSPDNYLKHFVIDPFTSFAENKGWIAFLLLVILYKLPDAALGTLANNFYLETGFSKTEIAAISKLFGFGATLFGTFVGGILISKLGLYRSLVMGCLLQSLTVLSFSALAIVGKDNLFLTLAIGLENFGGGISDICLVVFISNLCNKEFTATQFALLSSLSALGRTFLRTPSGFIAVETGWPLFFAICAATAIPCLFILLMNRKNLVALGSK